MPPSDFTYSKILLSYATSTVYAPNSVPKLTFTVTSSPGAIFSLDTVTSKLPKGTDAAFT